jgi:histidyl-tRNA synthetase
MRTQRCKGTRDLLPEEMARFRLIESAFRDCCLKWGYKEVRTPILEYLHLFTSVGTLTPSQLSKVYSFLDWDGWSGERVVLRPDGTIPVTRLYIDSLEKEKPARLFYIANVFIFEETGKKTRERWQCGAELIGSDSPLADVELITLALAVLKKLGIKDIKLKLSHAGLIKALLNKLGLSPEEQAAAFDRILDGDTKELAKIKKNKLGGTLTSLLNLKGKSSGFLKDSKAGFNQALPEFKTRIDNFIAITELLEDLDCDYQIDIASGRGFEYYTGVIFQLFKGEEKIGGGGRYDDLIPLMGGKDIPASGGALYLDRLMNLVKAGGEAALGAKKVLVRVKADSAKEGFGLAERLRRAGYIAELKLGAKDISDFSWVIDIQVKEPIFTLTDKKGRKFTAKNPSEVLGKLEEKGGDKGSAA